MSVFESIILGIVQGVTEFLPISSTGHLWIFEELIFGISSSIALEIFFHLATLLAVILFFWKKIWLLTKNLVLPKGDPNEKTLALQLLLATFITGVLGIALQDIIEDTITKNLVALTLFLTGILILVSEYFSPKTTKKFSWSIAMFLGAVQAIAIIPGISRSGITIVFLILLGIEKKKSLEISFLLSIPTILGAFIFLLPELSQYPSDIKTLALGGISAFIAAFFTIWGMMEYITKVWKWFSVWCFGVAGILLFL